MKNIVKTRLAILLKITGWSIQELANRSNLSSDTVKNLYYGRIDNPKIETLIAIADAFGISLDYLVGRLDYAEHELKHLTVLGTLDTDTKEIIELIVRRAMNKRALN
jgi:transcriptional regulator with XRE-family HTH domain